MVQRPTASVTTEGTGPDPSGSQASKVKQGQVRCGPPRPTMQTVTSCGAHAPAGQTAGKVSAAGSDLLLRPRGQVGSKYPYEGL